MSKLRKYINRQEGGDEQEFLKNWYSKRKIKDKYIQEAYELDKPNIMKNLNNFKDFTYVDNIKGGNSKEIQGLVKGQFQIPNKVLIKKGLSKEDLDETKLHELNHYSTYDKSGDYMTTIHQNIVDSELLPKEYRNKEYQNDYYSDPREVHSRIMVLRKDAGFKPDKPVTMKDLDGYLKKKEVRDQKGNLLHYKLPSNVNDIFNNAKDHDSILNMLNYMAVNESTDNGVIKAQEGVDAKDKLGRKYTKNSDGTFTLKDSNQKYDYNTKEKKFLKIENIPYNGLLNAKKSYSTVAKIFDKEDKKVSGNYGYTNLSTIPKIVKDYINDNGQYEETNIKPYHKEALRNYLGVNNKNELFEPNPNVDKNQFSTKSVKRIKNDENMLSKIETYFKEHPNENLRRFKYDDEDYIIPQKEANDYYDMVSGKKGDISEFQYNDIQQDSLAKARGYKSSKELEKKAFGIDEGFLGKYTIRKGKDKNGEYVSYYDKWDLAPGGIPLDNVVGKPFEFYNKKYINKKQQGGKGNLVNAEAGEVYKDKQGNIMKVSDKAPSHDDGVLVDENENLHNASYNNGGVVIDANSVLSATHENRDSSDKSYGLVDELIKIKPKELKQYGDMLGLKVKSNKAVSPSKAFELLRDSKIKQVNKLLNVEDDVFADSFKRNSIKANLQQANSLISDEELYDTLFQIQEQKKLI